MNTLLSQAILPATAAALFISAPALTQSDIQLAHSVAAGAKLTKTLRYESTLELASGVAERGGEPQEMPPEFSMDLVHAMNVEAVDVYGERKDGVLMALTRTLTKFEDVFDAEVNEGRGDAPETGNLTLETVLVDEGIKWTKGEDGYEASPAADDSALETDDLAGLTFDLDGFGLLPPKGANLAEGWTVPASALAELLGFGGDPAAAPADPPRDAGDCILRAAMPLPMLGDWEGDVALTLVDHDEETGIAEVKIEADVTSIGDALDYIQRLGTKLEDDELEEVETNTHESRYELEGMLLWDVQGGHLSKLSLGGDLTRQLTFGSEKRGMKLALEFVGSVSWELEFAAD